MTDKTRKRAEIAIEVLTETHPMTVRQVYYQLVARHIIANTRSMYQQISVLLVTLRQNGTVPWEWIEDRNRRPRQLRMWSGLPAFSKTAVNAYHLNVWRDQPELIEIWLEKDALSGIFADELEPYRVALNVGRGYDGWSSIREAAMRYQEWPTVHIAYFGDFDPSGMDMERSLVERLQFFDVYPIVTRWSITEDDIDRYELPPDFAKKTDKRYQTFVAGHGDRAVELDALPLGVLRERIRQAVETVMDMAALGTVIEQENRDKTRLFEMLSR